MRIRATSMGFRDWFTSYVFGFRSGVVCRVVLDIGPWRLYCGRRPNNSRSGTGDAG